MSGVVRMGRWVGLIEEYRYFEVPVQLPASAL